MAQELSKVSHQGPHFHEPLPPINLTKNQRTQLKSNISLRNLNMMLINNPSIRPRLAEPCGAKSGQIVHKLERYYETVYAVWTASKERLLRQYSKRKKVMNPTC